MKCQTLANALTKKSVAAGQIKPCGRPHLAPGPQFEDPLQKNKEWFCVLLKLFIRSGDKEGGQARKQEAL